MNDENKCQFNHDLRQVNQTFIGQYILGILRFNSSDRGYYWCQMVINNVSLSPSPYGHISSFQCPFFDVICDIDQPICAQNTCVQYMALKDGNGCSLMKFSTISPTRTTIFPVATSSIITTLLSREGVNCDQSRSHICAAGIVSGLVVLILLSLMVMVLCFFIHRKNRRHQGTY